MGKVDVKLAKDVAWLRHTRTNYDKHYDLMFDADGNPTLLRKRINSVLGRVATGELSEKYIGGVRSEINCAVQALAKQNYLKRMATKKPAKRNGRLTSVKMQTSLLAGVKKYYATLDNHKYKMLSYIGMRPKQLHKWRRMLPYYPGEKDGGPS